ncbi:MAG: hypothetical protein ACKVT2_17030 [Saprospiraceae bacterium]
MKKLFTLTCLFFIGLVFQANAQFLVGGNVGFSSMKETEEFGTDKEESKTTFVTVIPRLGYVFGNKWAGIDVGMTSVKSEFPDFQGGTTEDKLNLISISPFFRCIKKPTDNMGIWLEAQAGAAFGKDEEDGREENKYSIIHAGIRPGVIFYVGNNLTFEASFGRLGFNQTTVKDADNSDSKTTTSRFGLDLNNNNFNIGILGESLSITSGFLFGVNWTFGAAEAN